MATRWLFLDMNSYFASCEQQNHPELRNRAIAVVPMDSDSTCVIAASYQAKAYGIRTGTNVGDAKRMCPGIVIVPVGSGHYAEYHKAILATVTQFLPAPHVLSVDEMACRLWDNEARDGEAVRLSRRIKTAIRKQVGECLTCSVGIASNVFLAKVASDLQKPDGLVVLREQDIPNALYGLPVNELPGIGRRMKIRLERFGICSIRDLYEATPYELRRAWGGVVGERWWYMLRGYSETDYPALRTLETPKSVGHSHILAPELRTNSGAERVLIRLTGKAVMRLRAKECAASGIHISILYMNEHTFQKRRWHIGSERRVHADDQLSWIAAARNMWDARPQTYGGWVPKKVSITLVGITPWRDLTLPLFEQEQRKARLADAIDSINKVYGAFSVSALSVNRTLTLAPERVAFGKITDDGREVFVDTDGDSLETDEELSLSRDMVFADL